MPTITFDTHAYAQPGRYLSREELNYANYRH